MIKHETGLLNLAEELGNVSTACQVMGYSRDTVYRYKSTYDTYCMVAHAKLNTTNAPITAADLLNDKVLPIDDEHELAVLGPRHGVLRTAR